MNRDDQRKAISGVVARRQLIRKIMLDKGFKSVYELQTLLYNDYDIEVKSVETLYNDMIYIDAFKHDDVKAYNNKVLANCEAHLENLNRMSVEAKYPDQRIKAINAYFKCVQEMKKLMVVLEERDQVVFEKKQDKEESEPVVTFG